MASSHVSQRVRRSAVSPTPSRPQPLRATVPYQLRAGSASPSGQGLPAVGKAATATTATTANAPSSPAAATPVPSPCAQPVVPCAPAAQNCGKRSAAAAVVVTTSTSTSTGSDTTSSTGGGSDDSRASELSPFSAVDLEERSSSVRLAVPSADHQPHQQQHHQQQQHQQHQQQQHHQQQHHHQQQQQRVSPERRSPSSPVPKVQRSRTFHVTAPAGAGWQGGPPGALTGPYLSGQWPREPPAPHHALNSTCCDKATQTPCTWADRAPERRSSLHRRSASWGSADPRREIVKLRQQLQRGKSRGACEPGVTPGGGGAAGVGGTRDVVEPLDRAAPQSEHHNARRENNGSPAAALGHTHASWPRRDSIPVSSVPLGRWGLAWLRGSLEGLNQELEGVFLHNEDADRARRQLQNAPDGHRAPLPCPPGRSSATRTVDTQTPPVPARRDARTPGSPERGGPRDRAPTVHGGSGGATRPADAAAAAPAASPSRRTDDGGGVAGAEAAAKRRSAAAVVAALGSAEGPESPCLARPAPLQPDGRSPFVCVCVEAEAAPTSLPSSGGPGASDGPHGAVAASGAAVAAAAADGAFFLPKLISAPRAGRSSTFPKPVRAARGPEDRPAPEGREGSPVGSCNLEEFSTQFGRTVTISSPDKNKVNFIPNSNSAFISIRSIRCASLSCLEGASDADWGPPPSCRALVMDRDTLLSKPAHINRGQAAPGLAGGWPESRNSGEQGARAACPSANRIGTPPECREPQAAGGAAARPPDLTTSPKPSSQGPPSGVGGGGLLGPPQNDGERARPQAGAAMPSQTYPVLC